MGIYAATAMTASVKGFGSGVFPLSAPKRTRVIDVLGLHEISTVPAIVGGGAFKMT
jgi:hypothetical protein